MKGQAVVNGDLSDPLEISSRVKQGCVLAPVLFSPFFICILKHAMQDHDKRVYICYHFKGSFFDLCWLTEKTMMWMNLIWEVLFADYCTPMAHTSSDVQIMLSNFSDTSKMFGLTISLGKTEVLVQPAPDDTTSHPSITINDTEF